MHIDGTFWSAPNLFKQVVSIHAEKNTQVFIKFTVHLLLKIALFIISLYT